jgi:hypothetical protein
LPSKLEALEGQKKKKKKGIRNGFLSLLWVEESRVLFHSPLHNADRHRSLTVELPGFRIRIEPECCIP